MTIFLIYSSIVIGVPFGMFLVYNKFFYNYFIFIEFTERLGQVQSLTLKISKIDYLTDSYFVDNTAFSQPYYNLVPLVNLSRGERKAFLKEYYTAFATLADRETYSFWEHYFLATPHKTHEQAWFLMRTREMLYLEKDGALYLLSGIPDLWRGKGKKIVLKNAHCLYGEFSLIVEFAEDKTYVEFNGGFTDIPVYISINGEFKRVMQSDKHIVFSSGKECDGR